MHGVGVAEEVVQVAEDFLVGADQEDTNVVGVFGLEGMYRQRRRYALRRHEVVDLAVAVAGDVLDGAGVGGLLIEPLHGHYGKELVDGPGVWQRLEEGEVAEIFLGQHLVDLLQLFGRVL